MDTQEEHRHRDAQSFNALPELFKCTEHNVGQVTAGEMTLCRRIDPDSPTHRQQTVTKTVLMISGTAAALSDMYKWHSTIISFMQSFLILAASLMKIVVADKGEIKTSGAAPIHTRLKHRMGRGETGDLKQPWFSETAALRIDKGCLVKRKHSEKESLKKTCTQPCT